MFGHAAATEASALNPSKLMGALIAAYDAAQASTTSAATPAAMPTTPVSRGAAKRGRRNKSKKKVPEFDTDA